MFSRILTANPDTLSFGEQFLSAIVGALIASAAATLLVSLVFMTLFALL